MTSKPSKFFKSRDATIIATDIIEEEEEPEEDEDNVEDTTSASVDQSVDTLKTPGPPSKSDSNIKVGIRVRPKTSDEDENVVDIDDTQVVVAGEKVFNFDLVFGPDTDQLTVYTDLVEDRVKSFIAGYSVTVFAYGQTGTGKTFSMGTNNDLVLQDPRRGIIARSLQQVFDDIELLQTNENVKLKISFLEIAKEQVYDLLNPSKAKVPLQVRELKPGCFRVVQLTEVEPNSVKDAIDILSQGSKLRSTESTALNSHSSRSHAVFSISIVTEDSDGSQVSRKLNLVDLAGSESQGRTGAVGKRFEEAKGINIGLTVLNRVISGLSRKQAHIPYRDSVLTKVLKESLESHCYISMLACISPSDKDITETVGTLRFSNDAKQLKTKPLPASLLESCRSSIRKRIPPTPFLQRNNTVHGSTPGSATSFLKRPGPRLNNTIATPGKRSRMDMSVNRSVRDNFSVSTVAKTNRVINDSLCDISAVGISMIEPANDVTTNNDVTNNTDVTNSSSVTGAHDMTSLLSPLMRTIRENMHEEFQKLKADFISSKMVSKSPRKTRSPLKMAKSRATSSPNRMRIDSPELNEEPVTAADGGNADCEAENFISGVGVSFKTTPRSVNPRLAAVVESASPDLCPSYDSPSSTSQKTSYPVSPTIEEMERTLGIDPNSPSLMFGFSTAASTVKKAPRSTRRTTMMASELNETLKEIQNIASTNRRRSVRVAARGKYYGDGSPRKDDENKEDESPVFRHPLLENEKQLDLEKQRKHNQTILDFINIGNVKLIGVSLATNYF